MAALSVRLLYPAHNSRGVLFPAIWPAVAVSGRVARGTAVEGLSLAPGLICNAAVGPNEWTVLIMKRVVAIAVCGLSLAACSSMPSWMQFDVPKLSSAATTMQFESEPAGAEAKTSTGQTCRTPCSLAMTASEFTVSFTLPGYQPQTVPVRVTASNEPRDPNAPDLDSAAPRMVPNPVFVELQPAAAPPPAHKKPPAVAKKKPKPAAKPAPTAMAPESPAPAPASPWPPAPAR